MPLCNKRLISCMTCIIACAAHAQSLDKYAESTVEMMVKKMSAHVYYVEGKPGIATDNQGFISNAGFVVSAEGSRINAYQIYLSMEAELLAN